VRRSILRHRHFVTICERAGLAGRQIHDTRRTMTSFAVATGAHANVIADRLGHSTTRLTMDRYASTLPVLGARPRTRSTALGGRETPPTESCRRK